MKESLNMFKMHCSPDWIPLIEHHCKKLELKNKEIVFNIGAPVTSIYFIQKGHVKVESEISGELKIIRLAGDGMILGHRGLHRDDYTIRATCLTNTTLTFIPIEIFRSVLRANPDLAMYLINFLSDELNEAEERNRNLQILDPRKKVALTLLKLARSFGYLKSEPQKLAFRISRQDIANMTGTTYETVIRTLSLLEKQKMIILENKDILIVNEKKLDELGGVQITESAKPIHHETKTRKRIKE